MTPMTELINWTQRGVCVEEELVDGFKMWTRVNLRHRRVVLKKNARIEILYLPTTTACQYVDF